MNLETVCGCNIYVYGCIQRVRQSEEKRHTVSVVTSTSVLLLCCPLVETLFLLHLSHQQMLDMDGYPFFA